MGTEAVSSVMLPMQCTSLFVSDKFLCYLEIQEGEPSSLRRHWIRGVKPSNLDSTTLTPNAAADLGPWIWSAYSVSRTMGTLGIVLFSTLAASRPNVAFPT